jgi:hypothetical protein
MNLQQQIVSEIKLRSQLLPTELDIWKERANDPNGNLGLHRSQIAEVELFLTDLIALQNETLLELDKPRPSADFTRVYRDNEQQLSRIHSLAAIFRHILMQREDRRIYRDILDIADLIAADCYLSCIDRAIVWGVPAASFRVPPLTYLNTMTSPAAFTRRHTFGAFKLSIEDLTDQKLPISIISLPFYHITSIWTFCSIYHEVGHLIDQDLNLQKALLSPLERCLSARKIDQKRIGQWMRWLREMIADTFGTLFGGPAFTHILMNLLTLPHHEVTTIDPINPHPAPYVRVCLQAALIRRLVESAGLKTIQAEVSALVQQWLDGYRPSDELRPYIDECDVIAQVLLDAPLDILRKRRLRDLAGLRRNDYSSLKRLAEYFWPMHRNPGKYPVRFVPAAAQMAIGTVADQYETAYQEIHRRALGYAKSLEHPPFLDTELGPRGGYWQAVASASPEHRESMRELVHNLRFGPSPDDDGDSLRSE